MLISAKQRSNKTLIDNENLICIFDTLAVIYDKPIIQKKLAQSN